MAGHLRLQSEKRVGHCFRSDDGMKMLGSCDLLDVPVALPRLGSRVPVDDRFATGCHRLLPRGTRAGRHMAFDPSRRCWGLRCSMNASGTRRISCSSFFSKREVASTRPSPFDASGRRRQRVGSGFRACPSVVVSAGYVFACTGAGLEPRGRRPSFSERVTRRSRESPCGRLEPLVVAGGLVEEAPRGR